MTLLTLAAKNVRHHARHYAAFFLSSSFAVWMFYLYNTLMMQPQVNEENANAPIGTLLAIVQVIVALFSVIFVLYSHSAFLRARWKEMGLWTLLGLTPRQLSRLVYYESLIIGGAAVVTGIGFGVLVGKLFFLAIARVLLLAEPIPFRFTPASALLTFLVFAAIFTTVSLLGRLTLRRLSVAEIFRSAVRPQAPPRLTWWQAVLGAACLGGAYALVLLAPASEMEHAAQGAVALLLPGTYLLFSQLGGWILRLLKRNPAIYWRSTNLLTISQMVHKLRDNARVLFMVAILSTMALSATGLFYSAYSQAGAIAERDRPVDLMLIGLPGVAGPERVAEVLAQHGLTLTGQAHLPVLQATLIYDSDRATGVRWPGLAVTSATALNQWLTQVLGREPIAVAPGQSILISPARSRMQGTAVGVAFEPLAPRGDRTPGPPVPPALQVPLQEHSAEPALNGSWFAHSLLVLDDAAYAELERRYGAEFGIRIDGYELADWRRSGAAYDQLLAESDAAEVFIGGSGNTGAVVGTIGAFREYRDQSLLLLFLTGFIAVLFFLCAGTMLYFKLLTDLNQERRQIQALYKVGIQISEIQRVVSAQTLVMFVAPVLVAAAHSALLNLALARSVQMYGLTRPLLVVSGVYLAMQLGFYLVTRRTYVRALLSP